ncbi:MAG TPA: TFIIB-type zinc ribbon-containing protein [Candidatus Hydrogenedentes bacterium]|nr:TFIIB-type zinc ribbon-containing protein [Candidatus Hydrogenedentota bacterium]
MTTCLNCGHALTDAEETEGFCPACGCVVGDVGADEELY